jgi:hypothetical protein
VPSKPLFKPPRHLVQEWPEVFEDLYMNTMPVAYLDLIIIDFSDGKVWEINIKDQLEDRNHDEIADSLLETFQEYKEEITKIDFKLDIEKLRTDIKNQTKNYL